MTAILRDIAAATHLLDPKETQASAYRYARFFSTSRLANRIAELKRTAEHEAAVIAGFERAYRDRLELMT